jgi:hypothetical protein
MKKIINYTIGCLSVVLILTSCSKSFITKTPDGSILTSDAISTAATLQSALNGAYNEFTQYQNYGRDFPVIGDLMADNTYVQVKNSNRYVSQYEYSVTAEDAVPG